MTPAERHRAHAAGFTARVVGAAPDSWDSPAPVEGWVARDVVRHLVEWSSAFLASGADVQLPQAASIDDDPVAAWSSHVVAVQALADDPRGRMLSNPHVGDVALDTAIDQFYTSDVFMHTWDLARATGQDDRLDPAECANLLAGMEPMDRLLRESGQYGPKVPVPDDADVQERLLGFIGRDSSWCPPSGP